MIIANFGEDQQLQFHSTVVLDAWQKHALTELIQQHGTQVLEEELKEMEQLSQRIKAKLRAYKAKYNEICSGFDKDYVNLDVCYNEDHLLTVDKEEEMIAGLEEQLSDMRERYSHLAKTFCKKSRLPDPKSDQYSATPSSSMDESI
jgi:hypothetical protein